MGDLRDSFRDLDWNYVPRGHDDVLFLYFVIGSAVSVVSILITLGKVVFVYKRRVELNDMKDGIWFIIRWPFLLIYYVVSGIRNIAK